MALDMGKGIASVLVARQIEPGAAAPTLAGIAAVLGHIYPVWLGFKGGKGVATTCGVFAVLAPQATAIAGILFSGHGLVDALRVAGIGGGVGAAGAAGLPDGIA